MREILWKTKLRSYLLNKLCDPNNSNFQKWFNRSRCYIETHTASLIDALKLKYGTLKGLKILDIGCGSGLDAINLAREGAIVHGVDIEPELIEVATLRAEEEKVCVQFQLLPQKSASPFEEDFFDVVIGIDVLEHVEDPHLVLEQCRRALKRGGIIFLSTPNRWALKNIFSDPHWGLFGVTLMPRKLARAYVVKVRKVIKKYDMTQFIDLPKIRLILNNVNFVLDWDSQTLLDGKLKDPAWLSLKMKSYLAPFFFRFFQQDRIRYCFSWVYSYLFASTWQVWAEKPD